MLKPCSRVNFIYNFIHYMITADAALQRVKGIKKSFDNGIRFSLEQYMNQGVFRIATTPEVTEIFTSTESIEGVEELGELQTPPSMVLQDGYSVTITEKRFGGAIILPSSVYKREGRDTTFKVDQFLERQRNKALIANKRKMIRNAHLMLNEAFDSTSEFLAPDGVEVCGTHEWKSGRSFINEVATEFDSDAYDVANAYAGAFADSAGEEMPLDWGTIVVKKGSQAHREAIRLFAKEIKPTAVNDINIYEGMLTVVETPFITAAMKDSWFLLDLHEMESPLYVGVGMYPSMCEPIKQENEALRSNIEGFWKQGVDNMPFQVYGGKP